MVLEKTLESPLDCKEIQPVHSKGVQSWVFSSTLATSCEELTHWKRLGCWEGLGAGGEGDDRGWDGWMASLTQWTWAWVNSGSWWWTGRPGVLQPMGLQRVGHDWETKLNWIELKVTQLCLTLLWFPRQEYWSGLLFPSPGDLSHPGMELASPALAGRFFTTEPPGKPSYNLGPWKGN